MARPFVEFVQSQRLPWSALSDGEGIGAWSFKILSCDNDTKARTMLARIEPGDALETPFWCASDMEVFVLRGSLFVNGVEFGPHHYGYWPSGRVVETLVASAEGALLILCTTAQLVTNNAIDAAPAYDEAAEVFHLDPFRKPWDQTGMDPNIAHLNAFRKNLRLGPSNSGRTYLLAGLPQGFPKGGGEPLERHPHIEEMFMVAGDMPCSLGVMRAGAYFWRPPGIWHGADCTLNGYLMFMRTPGTNKTISEWAKELHPVRFDPPYTPQLPENMLPFAGEHPDPLNY